MKLCRFIIMTVILLAVCAQAGFARQVEGGEPLIRVGLASNQSRIHVSADSAFYLLSGEGKMLKSFPANQPVDIVIQDGGLKVNGAPVAASVLRLGFSAALQRGHGGDTGTMSDYASKVNRLGSFVSFNGNRYRGVIEIRQIGAKLTVINILRMEEYLYGVIPKEIPPNWPIEAIKAQAVAARSYAFTNTGKHQDQGFEVCATVHCQVYGGRDVETVQSNQAVDETRGMMATYGGAVITAFFHSSSGGHTESSENVWGTPYPYLRGVADYDQGSPRFSWERRISAAALADLLRAGGVKIGRITVIELTPFDKQPVSAADRGVSGRVKTVKIVGDAGSIQLSGARFSSLLSLPSSLFDISVIRSAQPVFSAKAIPAARRVIHDQSQDMLLIAGRGAGHGIGLSQWGAKAMAEKFASGRKSYYQEILTHYYRGVKIEKWY